MKDKAALIFKGLLILIGFTMLYGCAGYRIRLNGQGDGYDVYRPEPYLLIKPEKETNTAEIIWLPNYSQRYRIKTWNFLGNADFIFGIQDGWQLTNISDKSDNTATASKLMDVVQKAVKEGAMAPTGSVQLFRLIYNDNGEFIGLKLVPIIEGSK